MITISYNCEVTNFTIADMCTFFTLLRDLIIGHDRALLSWSQCGTTSALPVTYKTTIVLVSNGSLLMVAADEPRSLLLSMEEYACEPVNYTVSLYGYKQSVSVVTALPACMLNKYTVVNFIPELHLSRSNNILYKR